MDNDELLIAIKDMFENKVDEVKNEVDEVKNHMGVLVEKLHDDIKTIAEGHSIIDKKIDNLQNDMDIVKNYIISVDTRLNEHEVILKRVK